MLTVFRQIEKIGRSAASVLIEGETGSGKDLAARAIHARSDRRAGPFVAVNCGAVPDGLIETELFGHGRGAFTDAKEARAGVVAQAERGTLFLDEADTLSPKAQVSLLRFLQDLRYRPVGTSSEIAADVRIIAATNQDLQRLVDDGRFRSDLRYRLSILAHLDSAAARTPGRHRVAGGALHPLLQRQVRRSPPSGCTPTRWHG